MPFTKPVPEWDAAGTEPPASTKQNGWQAGDKPPADWFNWFFHLVYQALQELQQNGYTQAEITQAITTAVSAAATTAQNNLTAHTSRTDNPHNTNKAQVGLGNADNTSDVNKPVSTAQNAAIAAAVNALKAITQNVKLTDDSGKGTIVSDLNGITGSKLFQAINSTLNTPVAGNYFNGIQISSVNAIEEKVQIVVDKNHGNSYTRYCVNSAWTTWRELWDSGNDGPGSGLDSDSVDGKHYSDITAAISTAIAALQAITQNSKITADDGTYQYTCPAGTDAYSFLKAIPAGIHTFYIPVLGTTNTPSGETNSIAGIAIVQIQGNAGKFITLTDQDNNTYTNALWEGTFSGWNKINNTAADVLTKLKTVDGAGSGLDSDTVDGHQSSEFLPVTTDYTIYVDMDKGNDSNDGLSSSKPLASLQKAFDKIPYYVSCKITISIQASNAGAATKNIGLAVLKNVSGSGEIYVNVVDADLIFNGTILIKGVSGVKAHFSNSTKINVDSSVDFETLAPDWAHGAALIVANSTSIQLDGGTFNGVSGHDGIVFVSSYGYLYGVTVNNADSAIASYFGSNIITDGLYGSGNGIGLNSAYGSQIARSGNISIVSTNGQVTSTGGRIV
ncbi:MAG: hypothetical protein ACE3JK_01610 [Sporolactobacillus sp.]